MGANPTRRKRVKNPIDNFTQTEKMHLGQLGIKWSEIKSAADVRRARGALKKYYALRSSCGGKRCANPFSGDIVSGGEPAGIAAEIYQGFHADEADKTVRQPEPHMPSGDYAQLGTLFELQIKPMPAAADSTVKTFIPTGRAVRVVVDNSRHRIYFAGGDQSLTESDLQTFGASTENICELGECRNIVYLARKYHTQVDEAARGKVVEWNHKFGEDGGERPRVFYNRRMKRLLLQGGSYEVRDEGIVN